MNILYITYDGLTDPLGHSQILPYLTGLAKLGHSITILSAEKDVQYNLGKDLIEHTVQKYNINWVRVKYHRKPKLISTIIDIQSLKQSANTLQRQNNYDVIHCRSYIASLVGLWLKRKHGVKFLFDMRGLWADERIEGGIWKQENLAYSWAYKYFKKKESEFLEAADHTVVLTEPAKAEILGWSHVPNQPITIDVIPCCVDLEYFNPNSVKAEDVRRYQNELNISTDDFILTYLGSIGTWYMLDEMLAFFAQLMKRKENAKFLFISRESPVEIRSSALKYGIPSDKIIVVEANRQEIPTLICLSTLSIFFIKPVYSKLASSPTKLGEVLSLGVPVIANSGVGDMANLFHDSSIGILVDRFTDEEYNRVIDQIDDIVANDKSAIREVATKFLSLDGGIKKYARVYDKLNS